MITLWEDMEAVDALSTSDTYAETVAAIEAQGFLRGEARVDLLERERPRPGLALIQITVAELEP